VKTENTWYIDTRSKRRQTKTAT